MKENELAGQTFPDRNEKEFQLLLSLQYKKMATVKSFPLTFDEVGFSVFSEFNEDGILLYLFSIIGTTNRKFVDIGAGGIIGSNTANLIIYHNWQGLLIEGSLKKANELKQYYSHIKETKHYPPSVINAWVTSENINSLIETAGIKGEIDLLSLDIDGIDYWVLDALSVISPRVILLEYQCIWGPEKSVTVPDSKNFMPEFEDGYGIYSGASLSAFVGLLTKRNYRLVGCHTYGFNAFFIRNDVGQSFFTSIKKEECFKHPFTGWAREKFFPKIKDLPWEEV